MTLSDFKNALYAVKENRRVISSLVKSIEGASEEHLSRISNGAIDYSKERVQKTPDPDKQIIEAIYNTDRDIERYQQKLRRLEEENEPFEDMILQASGIGAEVLRLYFLEGKGMKQISEQLDYSQQRCWELWKKTIKELYQKEGNEK